MTRPVPLTIGRAMVGGNQTTDPESFTKGRIIVEIFGLVVVTFVVLRTDRLECASYWTSSTLMVITWYSITTAHTKQRNNKTFGHRIQIKFKRPFRLKSGGCVIGGWVIGWSIGITKNSISSLILITNKLESTFLIWETVVQNETL